MKQDSHTSAKSPARDSERTELAPYEPPKVHSLELSEEAAEALT